MVKPLLHVNQCKASVQYLNHWMISYEIEKDNCIIIWFSKDLNHWTLSLIDKHII